MRTRIALKLILCLAVIGCQPNNPPAGTATQTPATEPGTQTPTELKRYPLKGKIVAVDNGAKKATIDHQEIPGFMGAMTMAYAVKDETALQSVKSGDEITADVVVDPKDNMWVENVTVVKKAEEGAKP
jgi:protein SCO1